MIGDLGGMLFCLQNNIDEKIHYIIYRLIRSNIWLMSYTICVHMLLVVGSPRCVGTHMLKLLGHILIRRSPQTR